MTWNYHAKDKPAHDVLADITAAMAVPDTIKAYLKDGVEALQRRYSDDVIVSVNAHGHVFTGEKGNSEATTATVNIWRKV